MDRKGFPAVGWREGLPGESFLIRHSLWGEAGVEDVHSHSFLNHWPEEFFRRWCVFPLSVLLLEFSLPLTHFYSSAKMTRRTENPLQ